LSAAGCGDEGRSQDVTVQLLVKGAGCEQRPIKVVLLLHPQQQAASTTQHTAQRMHSTTAGQPPGAGSTGHGQPLQCTRSHSSSRPELSAPARQSVRAQEQGRVPRQQGGSPAAGQGFDPQEEPVADMVCGASHQVVLCQASQHVPSQGEVDDE
jgi:hypothetical protein